MITIQYLSGFFDGEGCVYYNTRNYGKGKYVGVMISQGETNENRSGVLKQIQSFLLSRGIKTRIIVDASSKLSSKCVYNLKTTSSKDCGDWLNLMLPHLIVKKQQAELAIEYTKGIFPNKLSESMIDKIVALREKGKSIHNIARELGISSMGVKGNLIRRNKYTPMKKGK